MLVTEIRMISEHMWYFNEGEMVNMWRWNSVYQIYLVFVDINDELTIAISNNKSRGQKKWSRKIVLIS